MATQKFLCDGGPAPQSWSDRRWDGQHTIVHQGPKYNLNLRIETLSHRLLGTIDSRSADLVRIAAYVYAADQMTSRGGDSDAYDSKWRREMALSIPVNDPAFWNDPSTLDSLGEVLHLLSEDCWEFHFAPAPSGQGQLPLNMNKSEMHGHADSVVLFSGGADSLCAVIQKVAEEGRRPLLLSHTSTPPIASRQRFLRDALRARFRDRDFPHISCWIHRRGSDAAENTQRTRAFLFAALGASVASALSISDVFMADNGVVSLNIPINDQLVGARATRSTHPKFIWLFNELVARAFEKPPRVSNPLWNKTRAETLETLKQQHLEPLLQETNSCSYARGRPAVQPHCGACSQCVDRRFGALATGLEEHDIVQRYGLDIFCNAIPEGISRTLVVSYVRFASRVADAQEDDLFTMFPQLTDCITSDDPTPSATARELTSLLKRHAVSVLDAMQGQIKSHSRMLAAGKLPASSLISLMASPDLERLEAGAQGASDELVHSPDFRSVTVGGERYSLTIQQGKVVELLYTAYRKKTPELSQAYILAQLGMAGTTVRDTFRKSRAWNRLLVKGDTRGTLRLNL